MRNTEASVLLWRRLVTRNKLLLSQVLLLTVLFIAFTSCGDDSCNFDHESDAGAPAARCVNIDFENLMPGRPVEGVGTVHPDLTISTVSGSAIVIAEGDSVNAFGAPNETIVSEGCLGKPGSGIPVVGRGKGFADFKRNNAFVFSFSPDRIVREFSVTMLDFGDYNPSRQTYHEVKVTAYDETDRVVDEDILSFRSSAETNPRTSDFGDLWYTGDACTARTDPPNREPGVWTFKVTGAKIAKVKFAITSGADPNIGFDNIRFCFR